MDSILIANKPDPERIGLKLGDGIAHLPVRVVMTGHTKAEILERLT
jgi:hypothetical protein